MVSITDWRAVATSKISPSETVKSSGQQGRSSVATPSVKQSFAMLVEADHALAETGRSLDELADGDRVEELIGGQQGEAGRHPVKAVVPRDLVAMARKRLHLGQLQQCAGLDQCTVAVS